MFKLSHKLIPNKTIILLTFSDIFTWGIYTVVTALTGLYLAQKLGTDAIRVVGFGMGLYMLARGLFEIIFGLITDAIESDKDEILFLTLGSFLMGLPFFFYPLITTASMFYILQIIFGIGAAMNVISWRKLFARNLDNHKEGVEYGIYGSIMSISIACFSIVTGVIANMSSFYFDWAIITSGLIIILGGIWSAMIINIKKRYSKNM